MNFVKKYYYLFLTIVLLTTNCRTTSYVFDNISFDTKGKDIYVIKTKDKKIKILISPNYKNKKLFIQNISRDIGDFGISSPTKKVFTLIHKTDSMFILCSCKPALNFYLKDIKFKKGYCIVQYKKPMQKTLGSKIKTPKSVQNILFKNALNHSSGGKNSERDLMFKYLKFMVIDFSDTVNVKLLPVSSKAFFDEILYPNK